MGTHVDAPLASMPPSVRRRSHRRQRSLTEMPGCRQRGSAPSVGFVRQARAFSPGRSRRADAFIDGRSCPLSAFPHYPINPLTFMNPGRSAERRSVHRTPRAPPHQRPICYPINSLTFFVPGCFAGADRFIVCPFVRTLPLGQSSQRVQPKSSPMSVSSRPANESPAPTFTDVGA